MSCSKTSLPNITRDLTIVNPVLRIFGIPSIFHICFFISPSISVSDFSRPLAGGGVPRKSFPDREKPIGTRCAVQTEGKLSKRLRNKLARLEYDLSDNEVLARGFAQYIAEKKSGMLLDEFQTDTILRPEFYVDVSEEKQKAGFQSVFENLLRGTI